ncbi:ABC transporter permease [Streptacidiphilus monticola]
MSALGKVVRAGVGRRRVQAAVIALSLLMAVTAALVAGTMLAVSAGPFDWAFARQHGAQLTAEFDESKVTGAQLAASAQASGAGVTATAGPFQEATITPPGPPGLPGMPLTVVGRASASGPVDRVDLLWGHWPTRADEIVLAQDQIGSLYSHETDLPIATSSIGGSAKSIGVAAGSMRLRVVGVASSVSLTAGGWVLPEEIAALRAVDPTRSPATSQMLYRFQRADSSAELSHDQVAVAASVPRDALVGSRSWLDTKLDADQNAAVVVPIIGAFGVLGLAMSVVIVAAVVSGAVGTSTRRIGVLKSLGFSPEQVVRAYVTQALVPAAVGAGLGLVLGNIAVQPLLGEAQQGLQVGALTVPWWLDAVVPGAALGVVVLAALVPRCGPGGCPRSPRWRWAAGSGGGEWRGRSGRRVRRARPAEAAGAGSGRPTAAAAAREPGRGLGARPSGAGGGHVDRSAAGHGDGDLRTGPHQLRRRHRPRPPPREPRCGDGRGRGARCLWHRCTGCDGVGPGRRPGSGGPGGGGPVSGAPGSGGHWSVAR